MSETVTVYNNRVTILHVPKAGKAEIPPETFAAMAPAAQMAAMIRPKYKYMSVALKPGANEVNREHLEMLEGKHNSKRNEAWMTFIRRQWVSLSEKPSVRAMPQRSSAGHKRFDGELKGVPGYQLPAGEFQPWPQRPIESLFDTKAASDMTSDRERLIAAAKGMGVSLKDKSGKALSNEDLLKAMTAKMSAKSDADADDAKPARIKTSK